MPQRWTTFFAAVVLVASLACGDPPLVTHDYSSLQNSRLRRLAEQQDVEAQYELGTRMATNEEAAQWYRLAADQGHKSAQRSLANLYAVGSGVPQDYSEANRLFRSAADGRFRAAIEIGHQYGRGTDVPRSLDEAMWFFDLASDLAVELKDPDLMQRIAHLFIQCSQRKSPEPVDFRPVLFGTMTDDEIKIEEENFERSPAHQSGCVGPDYPAPNKPAEAFHLFELAVEMGNVHAIAGLGRWYFLYPPACRFAETSEPTHDGSCYLSPNSQSPNSQSQNSQSLTPQSVLETLEEAIEMFNAQVSGEGRDLVQAYKWLNIAASREAQISHLERRHITRLRNRALERLTADQVAEAQRLAREWDEAHPRD